MTDDEKKEKAMKAISEKIKQAEAIIFEAEAIANENGVSFDWEGFAYGMGGYFVPKSSDEDWSGSYDEESNENGVWLSSSRSC